MVEMVMGDKDVVQSPALALKHVDDRRFLGRVDGGRHAGFRIVDEDAEIILAARKLLDLDLCHFLLPVCRIGVLQQRPSVR